MSEIVVHRCVVRIRRTSGWAWGASPESLVQAATRALPNLIVARLPAIASSLAAPARITRPIKIQLETTIADLVALADAGAAGNPALAEQIAQKVAEHVNQALDREQDAERVPDTAERHVPTEPASGGTSPDLDPHDVEAPRRAARAWWRSGAIEQVLAQMEPGAIARLHDLLLPRASSPQVARGELLAIAETIVARIPLARSTGDERARIRIAIAAALIDAFPSSPESALVAAVDQVLPHERGSVPRLEPTSSSPDTPAARAPRAIPTASTIEIRSVLPFLLLPSLHHARWLDTAATLLASHDLDQLAFALAAGLAAKVLDPPSRGWARTSADRAIIAAFVSGDEAIEDGSLATAAARLTPLLDALDASLRTVLVRARRPGPLVLARDDHAWLLLDGGGMTVLGRDRALRPTLAAACTAPILVPSSLADSATLDALDLGNHRFITDAPPTRGESWRRVRGVTRSLATNDTETPTAQLVAITADFDASIALASELVEVLAARPVLPRDPLVRLDATCTLAATAALADLGARLFPAEPTTPVLALTRFRDLDAEVTFEPDRIRVRVPLGRRHADLMRHGILGELARIPWLGGRILDLGGA